MSSLLKKPGISSSSRKFYFRTFLNIFTSFKISEVGFKYFFSEFDLHARGPNIYISPTPEKKKKTKTSVTYLNFSLKVMHLPPFQRIIYTVVLKLEY